MDAHAADHANVFAGRKMDALFNASPSRRVNARPQIAPVAARRALSKNAHTRMARGAAPSAIRTPYSCVRCATGNAIAPYMPAAASITANAAHSESHVRLDLDSIAMSASGSPVRVRTFEAPAYARSLSSGLA